MGFYLGVNAVVHGFCKWVLPRVLSSFKKGSKGFKHFCANQVLYGCQAGSKKDFKGFYLRFMQELKLFVCMSITGFYTEPNIVALGPFRNAERT